MLLWFDEFNTELPSVAGCSQTCPSDRKRSKVIALKGACYTAAQK